MSSNFHFRLIFGAAYDTTCVCLTNNDNDGVRQASTVQVKEKKIRGEVFKKDQTLRLSKVLGEAFVEGPSRFYIAAAVHVSKGEIISGIPNINDRTIP